jgi:hypothetical protein
VSDDDEGENECAQFGALMKTKKVKEANVKMAYENEYNFELYKRALLFSPPPPTHHSLSLSPEVGAEKTSALL